MTEIFVVGLSHHTAPVSIREQVAATLLPSAERVQAFQSQARLKECVVISTCNRVEVYGYAADLAFSTEAVRGHFVSSSGSIAAAHLYEHVGTSAVRHAFRVASSLDSMVVGEPQILGQVKTAMSSAQAAGTLQTVLSRCFQFALQAAKQVRAQTAIAAGAVSVSSVAADLASKIFGVLKGRHVLLVGAGKMGESAAKKLTARGAELYIVNRNRERGVALAQQFRGAFAPYEQLQEKLAQVDIAITSTASDHPIIDAEMIGQVVKLRRHRPLFLIDIAVPRNVDPEVGKSDGVYVYDLDDLQKLSEENIKARQAEISAAEQLLQHHIESFEAWRRSLLLAPTITALRNQVYAIVHDEMSRLGKDLEKSQVERWSDSLVNKLLNRPLQELKMGTKTGDAEHEAALLRRLFGLYDNSDGS